MTLKQIASLGKELAKFLALFACCFRSRPGFALCTIYVQGLLSSLQRKNVEAISSVSSPGRLRDPVPLGFRAGLAFGIYRLGTVSRWRGRSTYS